MRTRSYLPEAATGGRAARSAPARTVSPSPRWTSILPLSAAPTAASPSSIPPEDEHGAIRSGPDPANLPVVALCSRFRVRVESCIATGLIVYLDLFPADIFLHDLHFLDDSLADADLLLYHRPFFDHDLFLDHGNHDLFFPDLRRGGGFVSFRPSSFDGHTLHAYLDTLFRHGEALPLGTHPFAHPHLSSFALPRLDRDLLFRAPYSHVVFCIMAGHIWRRVSTPCLRRLGCAGVESTPTSPVLCVEPKVKAHPSLELGRNLLFVAQAWCCLHQAPGV